MRIDFSWSSLETERQGPVSPWYIQKTDRIFKRANDRGLKIVAVLWWHALLGIRRARSR